MTAPSGSLWVGITNQEWFDQLQGMAAREPLDEVNFWRPSGQNFQALAQGGLFLFKLHAPRNVIAGGGFFSRAVRLPVAMAWQTFGARNGVTSEAELRRRIERYHHGESGHPITCIILSEPFFFPAEAVIPAPASFSRSIQAGKVYDLADADGRSLWAQVQQRLAGLRLAAPGPAQINLMAAYGAPRLVAPRLGQGGFRIGVLENYQRRCAISGERTVPVLEAAHIRRYSDHGRHELSNGLLLRSDLHKLFDLGYIAVEPRERRIVVSKRIRDEFENGRDYYAHDGQALRLPADLRAAPDPEALAYHFESIYLR